MTHAIFYNQATFELTLRPRSPLLIKAGGEGMAALDPTLPDMNFVRTRRADGPPEVYLPGSSLRGVVRSYAERLLRSVNLAWACNPVQTGGGGNGALIQACGANPQKLKEKTGTDRPTDVSGPDAYYKVSCPACRIFGNTLIAGRVRFGDLYLPEGSPQPNLETRYGVAIDRVTGAVAQGPFEFEILTNGRFGGSLTLRNFTVGQLGLLAAALLDMGDGLVPLGFGKSKGLGRVEVTFNRLAVRTLKDPNGYLWGMEALREVNTNDKLAWDKTAEDVRGFFEVTLADNAAIRNLLEETARRWTKEIHL